MPPHPSHKRSLPVYIGAGLVSTGSHYAVMVAAVELAGLAPLLATVCGFTVGALVKYVLNYFIAFRSAERHGPALARFAGVLALLFAMNAALFALLNGVAGLNYILAQVLTTGLLILPGYLASRSWVFLRRGRGEA